MIVVRGAGGGVQCLDEYRKTRLIGMAGSCRHFQLDIPVSGIVTASSWCSLKILHSYITHIDNKYFIMNDLNVILTLYLA